MAIASTGNLTKKHTSNVVAELIILRSLVVTGHPSIAPKIIQVDWIPPSYRWNKVKTDGTARGLLVVLERVLSLETVVEQCLAVVFISAIYIAAGKGDRTHWNVIPLEWSRPFPLLTWSLGRLGIGG